MILREHLSQSSHTASETPDKIKSGQTSGVITSISAMTLMLSQEFNNSPFMFGGDVHANTWRTIRDDRSWASNFKNCETITFCCLNHLVCSILLQQPQMLIQHLFVKTKYYFNLCYCHIFTLLKLFLFSFPWLILFGINCQGKKNVFQ